MIVLVRHGRVALPSPRLASRQDMLAYVDDYDRAPLCREQMIDPELTALLADDVAIFSSTSGRAMDTARLLAPGCSVAAVELFGEEPLDGLPHLPGRAPSVVWLVLARLAGVLRSDLRARMHRRAGEAATTLIAASQGGCALVGHGWFNRAIGRALRQRGWRLTSRSGGSAPLSYAVYKRPTDGP